MRDTDTTRRDAGAIPRDTGATRRVPGAIRRLPGAIRRVPGATRRVPGAIRRDTGATRRVPLLAAMVIPAVLAALAVTAFAWSAARLAPRDLPVGVSGPGPLAAAIGHGLDRRGGAFDVHFYRSSEAAAAAIRHRGVYGAFVATPGGLTVLTAPAASPAVAQVLAAAGQEASRSAHARMRVVDLVPADRRDPQGLVLDLSFLPLVIIASIGGVIARAAGGGRRVGPRRAGVLLVKSALVGLVAVGIVQGWLGVIPGNWAANAAALGLTVLAISAGVCGLGSLLGGPGVALGMVLMLFVGNPFSAVSSAPQMLPKPVGALGQWLPPGAGGSLLRSVAFFHGYGSGRDLAVLAVWAAAGLAAVCAGRAGRRSAVAVEAAGEAAVGQPAG
jgi:hypothetical protein